MGKISVIMVFLACFVVALLLFFSKNQVSLRENMESTMEGAGPRLLVKGFIVRKYRMSSAEARFDAGLAVFKAPNMVHLTNRIKGWQDMTGQRRVASANHAVAYFETANLIEMLERAKLNKVDMGGGVLLGFSGHKVTTQNAEYFVGKNLVRGDALVKVLGPKRWFTGQNGFRLSLKEEKLDVYGKIRGSVASDSKEL